MQLVNLNEKEFKNKTHIHTHTHTHAHRDKRQNPDTSSQITDWNVYFWNNGFSSYGIAATSG